MTPAIPDMCMEHIIFRKLHRNSFLTKNQITTFSMTHIPSHEFFYWVVYTHNFLSFLYTFSYQHQHNFPTCIFVRGRPSRVSEIIDYDLFSKR